MKILELIDGKTLIITPGSYKKALLKKMNDTNELYNVKFMTLEEYKRHYLFDYDVKTIYYLVHKYGMKVSNAKELINNLYYIEDKAYQNEKLNYLLAIKSELDKEKLLIYDDYFKDYLETVKVIVYGYGELDKFTLHILNNLLIVNDDFGTNSFLVYEFNNIIEEVEVLFNRICDLLEKKIDINHIKLMNVTSEYIPYLKRFSTFYQIPISFKENSLYGRKTVNDFLNDIKSGLGKEEIVSNLSKDKNSRLYPELINILNKYVDFDHLRDVYSLILYDVMNTKMPSIKYANTLELIELDDYVSDDDYVFLVGFNNGNIPVLYKDEDYITDNIKDEVFMSDTNELNRLSNLNTLNFIKRIKNLVISYKLKTPFNTYFVSNLIDELKTDVIENTSLCYQYSLSYNKIKYANMLDDYVKYGDYNQDLGFLYHNYGDISYNTYNNKYHEISKKSLLEYLNDHLTLSYSSVDNYYKCSFRYYLTNVLNIDLYEESFSTIIGNIFHNVLSKAFDNNFDFSKEFNQAISEYSFNSKEKFFVDKLKNDLLFIISVINDYRKNTGLVNEMYEKRIMIPLREKPEVVFKGFIDKIMYKEKDGITNVSIIDYKTGNPHVNLDYLKYGLSMQLPSYLYLVSYGKLFDNVKYSGFYLQHILDNEIKREKGKSYLDLKRDNLKLVGYSTSDLYRLAMLDDSYENSMMIKGLKIKKDGEISRSSKVLSDDEIDSIIALCEQKIKDSLNSILDSDFSINPKVIDGKNIGCEYCHYQDICYHKEDDNVYLESEME